MYDDITLADVMEAVDEYLYEAYNRIPIITENELDYLYLELSLFMEGAKEPVSSDHVKKFLSNYNAKYIGKRKDPHGNENPCYIVTMPNGDKRKMFLDDSPGSYSYIRDTNSKRAIKANNDYYDRIYKRLLDRKNHTTKDNLKFYGNVLKNEANGQIHNIRGKYDNSTEHYLKAGVKYNAGNIVIGNDPNSNSRKSSKSLAQELNHEYGHTKEFSNARKVHAMPDFWSQINYNKIPKQYRSRFLEAKRKNAENPSNDNSKKLKDLKSEIRSAILKDKNSNIDDTLRNNEYLKSAHHALRRDIGKEKAKHLQNAELNKHDKEYNEIYADAVSGHITHNMQNGKENQTVGNSLNYEIAPIKNNNYHPLYRKSNRRRSEIEKSLRDKSYMKYVTQPSNS